MWIFLLADENRGWRRRVFGMIFWGYVECGRRDHYRRLLFTAPRNSLHLPVPDIYQYIKHWYKSNIREREGPRLICIRRNRKSPTNLRPPIQPPTICANKSYMEGVGARLGRSSTRYGPATVFTGPVRKWKKKWIHVTPTNTSAASNNKHHHHQHQSNGSSSSNGNNNNASASHLLLYKWTPIRQTHNTSANNNNSNGDANEDGGAAEVDEEPPRRKMKYIPVLFYHLSSEFLFYLIWLCSI